MGTGPGMVEIPFTGVMAEKLGDIDMLKSIWVNAQGYEVKIPSPASYIAHKLYINPERKPVAKRSKDIEAVRSLLLYFNRKPEEVTELKRLLDRLPSKKRARIDEVAIVHGLVLPTRTA